jgi:hypothetical protein
VTRASRFLIGLATCSATHDGIRAVARAAWRRWVLGLFRRRLRVAGLQDRPGRGRQSSVSARTSSTVRLASATNSGLVSVVRDDQGGLVERVAAGPVPGAVGDAERPAERCPPGPADHAPRRDHIGGRVADAGTAEVDDRAEPATVNEQVGPQQAAVQPRRCSLPRR